MATPGLRLAALLVGLLSPPGDATDPARPPAPDELPRNAHVSADSVETFAEPDPAAFTLDRLDRGDVVRVVDIDPVSGWLTIEPPPSAFAWVEQSAVRPEGPGSARVSATRATVRAGVPGTKLPGPPRAVLKQGSLVRLIDRPPLEFDDGQHASHWLAIAPTPGDVRYVRREGMVWFHRPPSPPTAETRVSYDGPAPGKAPAAGTGSVPVAGEASEEMARIESEHRAVINGPVESWQLDPIRQRYQALLKNTTDPSAAASVRERLELVERHAEIARSARTIQTILERSRRRDRDVELARQALARSQETARQPYAAEGLVQRSSRQVEGRRVFALIGAQGVPVAYLDIPPGFDTRRVMAKKVGIRGSVHYNESLGSRLIAVREMDPLE